MTTVELNMTDELTGSEVIRSIDISNVIIENVVGTIEQQKERLNEWITNRGNPQHETILTLNSWEIK